jgi:phospholipid/cholesterol/gamma-HCH transport system substrate-binding protein
MTKKPIDLLVGLFVLLGFAALVVLALKAGNLGSFNFSKGYEVQARFDNIGGLKVRAPVKSAGVLVGRVASVSLDAESYEAIVVLNMDSRFGFPKDSSAKILTSGLLGEQYVGIEPGGASDKLAAGGRIKNTQSAIVLEKLISQFLYNKAGEDKK